VLADLRLTDTARYNQVKDALTRQRVTLPPSAAIAGVYARVDRERGVWKAPANVSLMAVIGVQKKMSDADQEALNVDPTAGKSINAIRDFTGKGTLVWGSRTLAGNDNEWRYVSVRRLFITIEENTRKASAFAVFEPNDATTWLKVRGMIESYLYSLWERGALAGSTPEAAYYVHVGLGTTMTPQDVLEGRLIVEIGVAAVRPAEFVVLRFMHKLQQG
jgi:phage tail sheath protein FI